jgi:RNA methyltransferase, TrmH family
MIPLAKLAKLSLRHRMRKMALLLGELERGLLEHSEAQVGYSKAYILGLAKLLTGEPDCPEKVATAALRLSEAGEGPELLRSVDSLRHALFAATGQAPADWDLLDPSSGTPDPRKRRVRPGVRAYLEDLRSPFNVGSVFRTADAFGVEELILSPACADPEHPRAQRSAMGAVELLPWRRAALQDLVAETPIFALELGGETLESFAFPQSGLVILGSEELGISREAREICTYGTVSIPMSGAKGSLNVAVAFGILMYAWTSSIQNLNGSV